MTKPNLPQPLRVWNHQPGDTYDLTVLPTNAVTARKRWGRGKEKRVINGMEFAHPNTHGDAILPKLEDVKSPNFAKDFPDTAAGLAACGYAPGEYPTQLEFQDLDMFIETASYPFYLGTNRWEMRGGDFPALWRIHMPWHRENLQRQESGQPAPGPTPPPITPSGQGSELYESGHEISAKLPKGTKIKAAVGALETAWGAINAMITQAEADQVPTSSDELMTARGGLLSAFHALNRAYQEGRDYITGTEAEEVQAAFDLYWESIHKARKVARDAKPLGWQLVAGDPRTPVYKYSRHNRIAWTGLSNMSTTSGLYGLRGEVITTGPLTGQRNAEYVDAFVPWDAQDPLMTGDTGSGGIGTPHRSMTDIDGDGVPDSLGRAAGEES